MTLIITIAIASLVHILINSSTCSISLSLHATAQGPCDVRTCSIVIILITIIAVA